MQLVIRSFRHRGLERFFTKDEPRGIPVALSGRILRMLDRLDASVNPEDMNLSGFRFHALRGDRRGTFAVSVSGNWRITFKWKGEDAIDVDFEEYH